MKYNFLVLILLLSFETTSAQAWKKDALNFVIHQDNDLGNLAQLKIPATCAIDPASNFATYEQGKSSLTIEYELDDDPGTTVPKSIKGENTDLIFYAKGLDDHTITGTSDVTITNKAIASGVRNINGISILQITFNYTHKVSGTPVIETGKRTMFIFQAKGTSLVNSEEHPVVVRLVFDVPAGSDNLTQLVSEIGKTLQRSPEE